MYFGSNRYAINLNENGNVTIKINATINDNATTPVPDAIFASNQRKKYSRRQRGQSFFALPQDSTIALFALQAGASNIPL